jgi:hypothetical protein
MTVELATRNNLLVCSLTISLQCSLLLSLLDLRPDRVYRVHELKTNYTEGATYISNASFVT